MAKDNKIRKIQNVFVGIAKNVSKKRWKCIVEECTEDAINSHLLMQNGILNSVAEKGHLVELRPKAIEAFKKEVLPYEFCKVGITQAISFPLFCNFHDTILFKEIECGCADYTKYKHLALYSYRSICAEIRRKDIEIEKMARELSSEILNKELSDDWNETRKFQKQMMEKGRDELCFYRDELIKDINEGTENYEFVFVKLPVTGIYVSTPSSLFSTEDETVTKSILNMFIFHLIPNEEFSWLVMGYHKNYVNNEVLRYIEKWKDVTKNKLGYMLTGMLLQSETWGLKPSMFNKIPQEYIDQFYMHYEENCNSLNQYPIEDFNLFEGIF